MMNERTGAHPVAIRSREGQRIQCASHCTGSINAFELTLVRCERLAARPCHRQGIPFSGQVVSLEVLVVSS